MVALLLVHECEYLQSSDNALILKTRQLVETNNVQGSKTGAASYKVVTSPQDSHGSTEQAAPHRGKEPHTY